MVIQHPHPDRSLDVPEISEQTLALPADHIRLQHDIADLRIGLQILREDVDAVARDERLDSVQAYMLRENIKMRSLIEKLDFRIEPADETGVHLTTLTLNGG